MGKDLSNRRLAPPWSILHSSAQWDSCEAMKQCVLKLERAAAGSKSLQSNKALNLHFVFLVG